MQLSANRLETLTLATHIPTYATLELREYLATVFYVCCPSLEGEAVPDPGDVRATAAAAAAAAAASVFLARACSVESCGRLRPSPTGNCWKLATCCRLCRRAAECS